MEREYCYHLYKVTFTKEILVRADDSEQAEEKALLRVGTIGLDISVEEVE
jgi:hypothetical protein